MDVLDNSGRRRSAWKETMPREKPQLEQEDRGNRPVFVGWWRPLAVVGAGYVVAGALIVLLWWWQH